MMQSLAIATLALAVAPYVATARPRFACRMEDDAVGMCRVDGARPNMDVLPVMTMLDDVQRYDCRDICALTDECYAAMTTTDPSDIGDCSLFGEPMSELDPLYADDNTITYVNGGCPDICDEVMQDATRPDRRARGTTRRGPGRGTYGEETMGYGTYSYGM